MSVCFFCVEIFFLKFRSVEQVFFLLPASREDVTTWQKNNIKIVATRQTQTGNIVQVITKSGNHTLLKIQEIASFTPKIQALASAADKVGLLPTGCWQLKTWGGEIKKSTTDGGGTATHSKAKVGGWTTSPRAPCSAKHCTSSPI